jgi:hypothetical protein
MQIDSRQSRNVASRPSMTATRDRNLSDRKVWSIGAEAPKRPYNTAQYRGASCLPCHDVSRSISRSAVRYRHCFIENVWSVEETGCPRPMWSGAQKARSTTIQRLGDLRRRHGGFTEQRYVSLYPGQGDPFWPLCLHKFAPKLTTLGIVALVQHRGKKRWFHWGHYTRAA